MNDAKVRNGGLTTHERMACRVPMIVPKWSALGEWPNGGVVYTTMSNEPSFTPRGVNTEGRAPSIESVIAKLQHLYTSHEYRQHIADKGYQLATQDKFKWNNIAQQFNVAFNNVLITET
jgi:hypothetical protein